MPATHDAVAHALIRRWEPSCLDLDADVRRGRRVHAACPPGTGYPGVTIGGWWGRDEVRAIRIAAGPSLLVRLPCRRFAGEIVLEDNATRRWGRGGARSRG